MIPEFFLNHPVFEKLEQFRQAFNNDNAKEVLGIDNYAFFDTSYNYINDRLKLTIPLLVQEAELSNIAVEVENSTAHINSYLGNNNSGLLTNATNNLNSAFNKIKNLPFALSNDDFDFAKTIANYQQIIKSSYDTLKTININLQNELAAVKEDIAIKQTQLTSLEQKLTTKETEIQNVLAKYDAEFETLKTASNTSIEADRNKYNLDIVADRESYKEQFELDNANYKTQFETQSNELDKNSKQVVSSLNTKLEEANKIVNIIGNVGVTGNYQNIANQNKETANFFRWVALFFMALMSGLLVWSIIELSTSQFDLYKSLVRILSAAVLTYPAIYAARESTKHRNLETKNRNLELELASIGPFIEILPEAKKQQIKEELVNKYFGNTSQSEGKEENEDVSINGLEKILKTILPYIKK